MNTQLMIQLAQERQQALLLEGSGVKPLPQTSWIAHIQNWLNQAKTQNHPTALN